MKLEVAEGQDPDIGEKSFLLVGVDKLRSILESLRKRIVAKEIQLLPSVCHALSSASWLWLRQLASGRGRAVQVQQRPLPSGASLTARSG